MTRTLTDREHEVLAHLVGYGVPQDGDPAVLPEDRRNWEAQLFTAQAGRGCECGTCPSFEIEDEHGHTPRGGPRVVLEATVPGAVLLLFIDGGKLSYLELAPYSDDSFAEFPPVAEIDVT